MELAILDGGKPASLTDQAQLDSRHCTLCAPVDDHTALAPPCPATFPHAALPVADLVSALHAAIAGNAADGLTTGTQRELRVVNLIQPEGDWDSLRAPLLDLLQPMGADIIIIHGVSSRSRAGPPACQLARPLRMHCDFVTADPPSHARRHGTALLSARPLLDDGVTLLHGDDQVAPVAAGFLRLDVDGLGVDVYVASLAPGARHRASRQRQAADLRQWMAARGEGLKLVAANFGASGAELKGLMPGLRASRTVLLPTMADAAHGLDLLFPQQCRLLETRRLALITAGTEGGEIDTGILVQLQLPAPPATLQADEGAHDRG